MTFCACGWPAPDGLRDRKSLLHLVRSHYAQCSLGDVTVPDCVDCGLPITLELHPFAPSHDSCRAPVIPKTQIVAAGLPTLGRK